MPKVSLQATFLPGGSVPGDGRLALWGPEDLDAALARFGLPPGEPGILPTVLPVRTRVAAADVPAVTLPFGTAVAALAALAPDWPAWERPGDSLLAWSLATKLALELVAAGHLVPTLRGDGPGRAVVRWRLAGAGEPRLARLAAAFPPAAHALRRSAGSIWTAADLLAEFCDAVAERCGGPGPGWLAGNGTDDRLVAEVAAWAAPVLDGAAACFCVRLDTPGPDGRWPLAYYLHPADDPTLLVPADQVWAGTRVFRDAVAQDLLIAGIGAAARLFPPIDASLSEQRPVGLALTVDDAAEFLGDGAAALAGAGLGVMLPAELTAQGARRLRARLRVGSPASDPGAGIVDGGLGGDVLREFHWEAALGEEALSAAEFAEIVALKQPLVRWKGHWIRVDPGELPALTALVGTAGTLSTVEALATALTGQRDTAEFGAVDVVADHSLRHLLDRLHGAATDRAPVLHDVHATLRDYQARGVAWLQAMADLRMGALLADDMGLGKTLQTIALLAGRPGDRPHLVVCPTSVVGNWEREIAKFAPYLPVLRHHGPDRPATAADFKPGMVAITSYGLLRRDATLLSDVDFDVVVLDEAQQIKNHAAHSARAARRLRATMRVALTGTPVENRLSELWSIVDFTNPGLLGPFPTFKQRYAVPIERWRDPAVAARLRQVVAPFMLRRLKSDPAVAADLPPKIEATVACTMTREQATLYQATVDALLDGAGLGVGFARQGRVLKLITALKQICNHPAQYLGQPGPLPGRSGKLARATEILAEVVAAGERALVFTQYREMGQLLARHLMAELDLPGVPFLHGGCSRAGRDGMVAAFQTDDAAPPLLIVSLKAGGTGLNLTRATNVVHYDRWWNPAVEDQATDRAYRIGQRSTVTVHKLVTGGTVEERVDALLADKRTLAASVVGAGESWLADLGDDELRALVELSTVNLLDVTD